MTLEEARAHVGAKVLYSSVPGECEVGEIIAAGKKYVHVLYVGQPNTKATPPECLTLIEGSLPPVAASLRLAFPHLHGHRLLKVLTFL